LSYFLLKILKITPHEQLQEMALDEGVGLQFNHSIDVFQAFLQNEKFAKRFMILKHLAATGWSNDEVYVKQKMDEYEHKTIAELADFENSEKPIQLDFYNQMEFPVSFQFALFFTFYTPIVGRFIGLGFNYLKIRLKR